MRPTPALEEEEEEEEEDGEGEEEGEEEDEDEEEDEREEEEEVVQVEKLLNCFNSRAGIYIYKYLLDCELIECIQYMVIHCFTGYCEHTCTCSG